MNNLSNIPISHYKVLSLPKNLEANSVYYLLDQNSNIVSGYITSKNNIAIPLFGSVNTGGGSGNVNSVTGTGVTGTSTNPKVDIFTFVSNQLGNLVRLSTSDGKLVVNPITSPDNSINISATQTELQIQLSTSIQEQIGGKEDVINKQDNLEVDGTGTKYPTVDAVNDVILRNTKLFSRTGIANKNDQFELAVYDNNTVRIKAVDTIVFWEELFVPNAVTEDAIKSFPEKIYPLSELISATGGNMNIDPIVSDGVYVRYLGYDKDGNIISSQSNFIESSYIAQLGFVTVVNTSSTVTFLGGTTPGGRNVFSQPILANINDIQRTTVTPDTDVTITYNIGTPSLKSNPGTITGLSINWRGISNPSNTSPIDKFNYLGDDTVDFISLTPLFLTQTTSPVIRTYWTDIEEGIAINESFFNTSTQLRDTLDDEAFGVKRVLIGLRGGIFIQESEFLTTVGYSTIEEAKANVFTHEFTESIIPPDVVIEIARIVFKKGVTDFSNENEFFVAVTTGGAGSGGGVASVSDATTISKGIIQLAGDLSGIATAPTVPGLLLKEDSVNKGLANGYPSLDANGLIPLSQIPPSVIERVTVVADEAARFALTTATVQNGDTVKQADTNVMYFVKNSANLNNNNGYEIYGAGFAESVPWGGVTDTPTTLAGYGITDALSNADLLFTADIPVVLPPTKTLGKYINGQVIPAIGKTAQQVITDIAFEYLIPTFASFSMTGQSTLIEVGTALSGNKAFTWTFNNSSNIAANTMSVLDVNNSNTPLAGGTGLSLTPPTTLNIGTITNTTPITQSWRGRATNTVAATFDSSLFTVSSIYPVFYGKSATPPVANQALINGGTKLIITSTGTVSITFAASSEYIWFAIPQITSPSNDKTKWLTLSNNLGGNIGVDPSDLFANDVIVSISSPTSLWSGVNYRIYVSNSTTGTTGVMELRNS